MEAYKQESWARTVFGRCMAAAVVGALALVAAPKAADALTVSFQDATTSTTVTVRDGDPLDISVGAGMLNVSDLTVGNWLIRAATLDSNALEGGLPAYLNINLTAIPSVAGDLIVTAWDDYTVSPGTYPAIFATSATLRNGDRAISEAWISTGGEEFYIGSPVLLAGLAASGTRSTTVALGETFRIYQQFTITGAPGRQVNIDGFVEVIPVPAALPLMLGGLGMLGFLGWRRKVAA
jgi:hypothetical protein